LATGSPLIKFLAITDRNKNFRTSVHVTSNKIGMNEPAGLEVSLSYLNDTESA